MNKRVRSMLLAGGFLAVATCIAATGSSRADFAWEQGQGFPDWMFDYACDIQPACTAAGCQNLGTPVGVVPDNSKTGTSVVVRSFSRNTTYTWGNCVSISNSSCLQYPNNGVPCALVYMYGQPDCDTQLGLKTVYAGNCKP